MEVGERSRKNNVLLFIVDVTSSMQSFVDALSTVLPEVIKVCALTDIFDRVGILSYGDYDRCFQIKDKYHVTEFSGWLSSSDINLIKYSSALRVRGGGGKPEAVKTALYSLIDCINGLSFPIEKLNKVYVLQLTDAPAHIGRELDIEGEKEKKTLGKKKFDFFTIVEDLIKFPVCYSVLTTQSYVPYAYICTKTGGNLHIRSDVSIESIRSGILSILNGWFGCVSVHPEIRLFKPHPDVTVKTEIDILRGSAVKKALDITQPHLAAIISLIPSKILTDEVYVEKAVPLLDDIIRNYTMSLCSNPIFGRLWREFNKRRQDPRRNALLAQLSTARCQLSAANKIIFDEWNKNSYVASDDIKAELDDFVREQGLSGIVYFIPDSERHPKDMLGFSRACTREDQALVVSILTRLVVDPTISLKKGDDTTDTLLFLQLPLSALPLNLPAERMFSLLLHVASPGTMLSKRPSAIVALLACRCSCVIREAAEAYLNQIKGTWLTWEKHPDGSAVISENFSVSFLQLLHSYPVAMTEQEQCQVDRLLRIAFAFRIGCMELTAQTIVRASMDARTFDYHYTCCQCKKSRPISLITDSSLLCAYCVNDMTDVQEYPDSKTLMVECSKCGAFYSRNPAIRLLGRSQCHGCFNNLGPSPREACSDCGHKFVTYIGLPNGKCRACLEGCPHRKPQFADHVMTVSTLFSEHAATIYGVLGLVASEFVKASIVSAVDIFQDLPGYDKNGKEGEIPCPISVVEMNGEPVVNLHELWRQVQTAVANRVVQMNLCDVCCDEKPANGLLRACGRTGCSQRVCSPCGKNWYGDIKRGHLVSIRHLSCPFCCKLPTRRTLTRWNLDLATAVVPPLTAMDPKCYHAWCESCNQVKEYGPMACGAGEGAAAAGPRLAHYECAECLAARELLRAQAAEREQLARVERELRRIEQAERNMRAEQLGNFRAEMAARADYHRNLRTRLLEHRPVAASVSSSGSSQFCPNDSCGVLVMRISGCNHITCICGQHFCFECGLGCVSAQATYDHMTLAHKSWFFDETLSDEEDDY